MKSEKFSDKQGLVFVAKGRHQLSLDWSKPKTLSIKCPTCFRETVFRQVVVMGNIDVNYQLGSGAYEK